MLSGTLRHSCFSAPGSGAEYCDERVRLCVRLCVCPRAYLQNYSPIFDKLFEHFTYGRGSVLLWRRGDTLCTSGFVDDIMGRIEKCRYRCSE